MKHRAGHPGFATLRRRDCLLAPAAALLAAQAGAQPMPLRVSLVPYLAPRAMLTQFEPLRRHLEASFGRPVEFYTASNFAALAESVRARQQPFTLMPMHLARIAVADWGHVLAARSTRESPVQLLAPRSLGLGPPESLRGRKVAAIDPLSVTAIILRRWLVANRLDGAVEVVNVPSASSAAVALARGEVAAIVVAQGQALDIPWLKSGESAVVVSTIGSVLAPCFVALADVPPAELAAFRRALLSFAPEAAAGASASTYVEGSPRDLEPYETYAAEARRLLAETAPARR